MEMYINKGTRVHHNTTLQQKYKLFIFKKSETFISCILGYKFVQGTSEGTRTPKYNKSTQTIYIFFLYSISLLYFVASTLRIQ